MQANKAHRIIVIQVVELFSVGLMQKIRRKYPQSNVQVLPLAVTYRHRSIITASGNLSCLFKYLQKDILKQLRFKYKSAIEIIKDK